MTWYDAATGGNVVATPSLSSVGSVTYYAESSNDTTGCTSLTRTAVSLEILAAPNNAESTGEIITCFTSGLSISAEEAIIPTEGFEIIWYDAATGGNLVAEPILDEVGSITYYAENYNIDSGCSSLDRIAVTLTFYDCTVGLLKEAELVDNNGCSNPEDIVLFTYTLSNLGNIGLSNINLLDPLLEAPNPEVTIEYLTGDDNNDGVLDLSELWLFTAEYNIKQTDLDAGFISSTATVNAETSFGEITQDSSHDLSFFEDGPTSIDLCQDASIGLIMSVVEYQNNNNEARDWNDLNQNDTADVGETITYSFSIKNLGLVPVTDLTISNDNPDIIIQGPSTIQLEPGVEDNDSFTASFVITQDIVDEINADPNRAYRFFTQSTVTGFVDSAEIVDDSHFESYDLDEPTPALLTAIALPEVDGINIYNGVTPNGDGKNDFFWIENIDTYQGNDMKIYNRWGVLVWSSRGYNETNNVFRGYSNVGSTAGSGNLLPTGTYFYVLTFDADSRPINGQRAYTGYLYLNQ